MIRAWRAATLTLLLARPIIIGASPVIFGRPESFKLLQYSDFQISDGVGGDADVRAEEIFGYAFSGADLDRVSYDIYDALHTMKEAVEDAEVEAFAPLIAQDGVHTAERQALIVGRTKNKVLWYTASVQATRIKIAKDSAQGVDTEESEDLLEELLEQLSQVSSQDKENVGQPSLGVRWPQP